MRISNPLGPDGSDKEINCMNLVTEEPHTLVAAELSFNLWHKIWKNNFVGFFLSCLDGFRIFSHKLTKLRAIQSSENLFIVVLDPRIIFPCKHWVLWMKVMSFSDIDRHWDSLSHFLPIWEFQHGHGTTWHCRFVLGPFSELNGAVCVWHSNVAHHHSEGFSSAVQWEIV